MRRLCAMLFALAGKFVPSVPFSDPLRASSVPSNLPPRRATRGGAVNPRLPPAAAAEAQTLRLSWSCGTALACQLLGMNCAAPTDFTFSFKGFACRGGGTDVHSDGWGLAFYEGRGLRCFHDPEPCADSPIANFVSNNPLRTLNMIAHIRYATAGKTCLENVHPFQREMVRLLVLDRHVSHRSILEVLWPYVPPPVAPPHPPPYLLSPNYVQWGIQWCFAHNGDVPLFKGKRGDLPWIGDAPGERIYNPVGDTDSEAIFCSILNALKAKFNVLPPLPLLHVTLQQLCNEIVETDDNTILNFLLGCGQHVQFAYSVPGARPGSDVWNGLYYTIREPPFSQAHLSDCDYSVDFSEVNTEDDRVAVIATKPLTNDEEWIELGRGELILFDDGLPYAEPEECFEVELQGHGLVSEVIPLCPSLEEDLRRFQFQKSFFAGADI